ncbi:Coenzyme PQQ synthesis protein D [Candidatus Methylomirabilis lanthanidiphila]|uniref:Coenzyme PQQ synthesis protein D n=1 Tax=Candidatus Methylomirabilis lanthanidiphila TaxID=2211376 RepID=A0A564ZK63_9BACT|nr:PqqD family protein [Candidatus Methylomirabilis lanthanidiphila]VUZ85516.1 Coenzyme PQQ synthesis protein D [Candidatus Methylomirabilis lanthanidiphila]
MTMHYLATACPIRSEHVTWKALEGESVLLNLETGVYFSLNETGTVAWELFDGATSLATVGDALCIRFNVPAEQVQQDLLELAQALLKEGLVKIREDSSTPSGTDRS